MRERKSMRGRERVKERGSMGGREREWEEQRGVVKPIDGKETAYISYRQGYHKAFAEIFDMMRLNREAVNF